jgi:hypothetical protein
MDIEGARIDFDSPSKTLVSLSKFVLSLSCFRQSAWRPVVEWALAPSVHA